MYGKPVSICTFVRTAIDYAFETDYVKKSVRKAQKISQLSASGK